MDTITGTKRCMDCGDIKSLGDFTTNRATQDGWDTYCRDCNHQKYLRRKARIAAGEVAPRGKNHGETRTPLWNVWKGMRSRCNDPNAQNYRWYGERGIDIDPAWDDYREFRDWALDAGYEAGFQLDREDNDKGYWPDNCRWTIRTENLKNRRAYLPSYLEERLFDEAERRGVGVYSLIREAIERYFEPESSQERG